MKRIYLALLTSIAALSLAGFTTFATWTDTVTVSNNQIQTGTADLSVSTNNGATWNTATSASSMNLTGLVPGGSSSGYSFSLRNDSTPGVNFDIFGQITSVAGAGADQTQLEIAIYESGSTPSAGSGWVTFSDWQSTARAFNSTVTQGLANSKHYEITARLKNTATNDWQGKTVTFTLTVNGQ